MTKRRTIGENPLDLLIPPRPPEAVEPAGEPPSTPEEPPPPEPIRLAAPASVKPPDEQGTSRAAETPIDRQLEARPEAAAGGGAQSVSFLTFKVNGEEYGLPILRVREIAEYMPATRVPATPPFIRGVLNLRGNVVPLVDLRVKFGLSATEITNRSCIVFVDQDGAGRAFVGLLVEGVDRVVEMRAEDIEAVPAFGARVGVEYLRGIGRVGDGLVLLLALDAVLGSSGAAPDAVSA